MQNEFIHIQGLRQNNLKNISLDIPKRKITVFTGVSGSGKSSIVFDTIAAESCRQMNETYPAFVRSRLPKHLKPECDILENLSPSVIIDQSSLGANARSTVGTSSEIYSGLRLLFSRIGKPYAGGAFFFSFNDPTGMCQECAGLGMVTDVDLNAIIDWNKSLNQGAICDSTLKVGSWYWKQFILSGFFDPDKALKDYTKKEKDLLFYGTKELTGLYPLYRKRYLNRETSKMPKEKSERILSQKICPVCQGKRLNPRALSCWINGYSIADFCDMELTRLKKELEKIKVKEVQELVQNILLSLDRMIEIGLGYLSLSRSTVSLSGGEAQRVKLVRYLGSSLSDMLYIFDEPSSGMHPRDVYRMNRLLKQLRDRGNTVLVVEHDEDVISIADYIVDVGPSAGSLGGRIVFQGSYEELLKADTKTAKALRNKGNIIKNPKKPTEFLPLRNVSLHNLKNCNVDIPKGCICTITGVAGSGKSSLMQAFEKKYSNEVLRIDQKPITATNRSTPASYLGFLDDIRKLFAIENKVDEGWFSFNSLGACPHCKGKGQILLELAFMDPIIVPCEECNGSRFSKKALSYKYKGKNILEILSMRANEAENFFTEKKILKKIQKLNQVGLSYLSLGQPLSTLSGGERQRIKLADALGKKSNIYVLDEPTTGLHLSDIGVLMNLFRKLVEQGNSVILIEHSLEVMKQSDYIIDIGPDGGRFGGEVQFAGSLKEMLEKSQSITAKCLRGEEISTKILEEETEEENMNFRLYPIGRVEQEEQGSFVQLSDEFKAGLTGLLGFSHIQIVYWFDACDNEKDRKLLLNEKPYTKGPEILGTFATRSPQRPNPIAISVAKILDIDEKKGKVLLDYLDAKDGTPVLDIKPYTPSIDKVEEAKVPDWCSHWPKNLETSGDFDWEKEFNF